MSTPPQRALARRRRERLDHIANQLSEGTLTIRKMTRAELKEWGPPKDQAAAKKRARRQELLDGLADAS